MFHANTFFNRSSIEIKVSLILLNILFKTSPPFPFEVEVNMTCGMLWADYTVQCKYSSSTSLTQLTSDLSRNT